MSVVFSWNYESKDIGVYKCALSPRWTAWLDQALLPVLQVRVCFANCVPCFNSQSYSHLALSNNLAASRILFLSSFHRPRSGPQQRPPAAPPPRPRPASAATLTTRGQQGSVREPGTYSVRSTAAEGRGARAQEGRNGSDALNCPVCFPLLPGILGTGSKKRRQMGSVEGWELGKRKKNAE